VHAFIKSPPDSNCGGLTSGELGEQHQQALDEAAAGFVGQLGPRPLPRQARIAASTPAGRRCDNNDRSQRSGASGASLAAQRSDASTGRPRLKNSNPRALITQA
jgi:hypothetical protein